MSKNDEGNTKGGKDAEQPELSYTPERHVNWQNHFEKLALSTQSECMHSL